MSAHHFFPAGHIACSPGAVRNEPRATLGRVVIRFADAHSHLVHLETVDGAGRSSEMPAFLANRHSVAGDVIKRRLALFAEAEHLVAPRVDRLEDRPFGGCQCQARIHGGTIIHSPAPATGRLALCHASGRIVAVGSMVIESVGES